MARYIDADELYKATQKRIAEANEARMAVVDDEFLDLINDAFTEDVAPRAEVEALRDEADRYKRYFYRHDYDEMIAEAKAEVAREIFEEMDRILLPLLHEVSQVYIYVKLKRKHTEAEPPKGDVS
jgi:hypothetical protein